MGSSHKSKSSRAKGARSGEHTPTRKIFRKAQNPAQVEGSEIPPGVLNEIENQRGVLITAITLLHCLHVTLERRQDPIDKEPIPRLDAAIRWACLPDVTAILLERTHTVLCALDPNNLTNALRAHKP